MNVLHLYSDETGSHTNGRYFVVAGIGLDGYHNAIRGALRRAETVSEKGKSDWHRAAPRERTSYLEAALQIEHVHGKVFFRVHKNIGANRYFRLTGETIEAAARHFGMRRPVRVAHEGFDQPSRDRLQNILRSKGDFEIRSGSFKTRPEIRFADALCGLIGGVRCTDRGGRYDHLMRDWFVEV